MAIFLQQLKLRIYLWWSSLYFILRMCHKKQVLLDDEDGVAHGTLVPDCAPACVLLQDQYNQ